jgi:hypothetical protein
MKYGRIFAATLRAGADFPDFVVARRWQTPGMRHSLLLELEKSAPGATARLCEQALIPAGVRLRNFAVGKQICESPLWTNVVLFQPVQFNLPLYC